MKRIMALLISMLMLVSLLPFSAFAETQGRGDNDWTLEKAEEVYNRTETFDHIDIRVAGKITYKTYENGALVGTTTKNVRISNPRIELDNDGDGVFEKDWSFTSNTSYEWRITRLSVKKSAVIRLKADVTIDGVTQKDQSFTFSGKDDFVRAIYICDGHQGLDFDIDETMIKETFYHQVDYVWTGLPDGLAEVPVDNNHYAPDDVVTVDTTFAAGDVIVGTDGKVYTFSGWTEYQPEGGDRTALEGASFKITADTTVYGVWTEVPETVLPGAVQITKTFTGLPADKIPAVTITVTDASGAVVGSTVLELDEETGKYVGAIAITEEGTYTVTESGYAVDGYDCAPQSQTVTITKSELADSVNTFQLSTVEVDFVNVYSGNGTFRVVKVWDVNGYEGNDLVLPASVKVQLYNGSTAVGDVVILSDENGWSHTWTGLVPGAYTVQEVDVPDGFTATVSVDTNAANSYVITNTLNVTSLEVSKRWDVPEDVEIPQSIEVQLLQDGEPYGDPVILSAENNWCHTWDALLPGYVWTVEELTTLTNYTTDIEYGDGTAIITNTYVEPTIDVTVNKVWILDDGREAPESIQVQLYRDGEPFGDPVALNEANGWTYTWKGLLAKYSYTVDEVGVPDGFEKTVNGFEIINDDIALPTDPPTEPPTAPPTNPPTSPTTTPATGDSSNPVYSMVLIVSATLALACVLLLKKKNVIHFE